MMEVVPSAAAVRRARAIRLEARCAPSSSVCSASATSADASANSWRPKKRSSPREFDLRVLFSGRRHRRARQPAGAGGLTAGEVLARAGVAGPRDSSPAHSPGLRLPDHARPAGDLIASAHADVLIEATPWSRRRRHRDRPHRVRLRARHGRDHGQQGPDQPGTTGAWPTRRPRTAAACASKASSWTARRSSTSASTACAAARCLGFDAVFNSTTNYILEAVGEGLGVADALAHVQEQGYAEADPSHDIDGHDAAAKTAALANVLMGADITPADVSEESIREISPARIQEVVDRATACAWSARRCRATSTAAPNCRSRRRSEGGANAVRATPSPSAPPSRWSSSRPSTRSSARRLVVFADPAHRPDGRRSRSSSATALSARPPTRSTQTCWGCISTRGR